MKKLLLSNILVLSTVVVPISVIAQTIIPASDGTGTIVNQNGVIFNIEGGRLSQDGTNLFHSLSQFNLTSEQIANFISNPNINNILTRITGGNPSSIDGLIQVLGGNSNLFIMNPAGLIFGNNFSLNVPGDFTATTATGIGFNNNWFNAFGNNNYANLNGNPSSFAFNLGNNGIIINAGNMEVEEGNNVNLIGGNVINTGTIKAPQGTIKIDSVEGTKIVRLTPEGSLLSLELDLANSNLNLSDLTPLDLPALLTGNNLNTGLNINQNGQVILTDTQTIIPSNIEGLSLISGLLDTSGNNGGNILILGNKVALFNANIDAIGNHNGGKILIGGDYQGQGVVPNSQFTFVDPNTTINADSLTTGNGGKVIIWSDQTTRFFGEITARGGAISGNGGFVEVSGKNNLNFQGQVNTFAPNGNVGTLLLDPTNLTIVDGTTYSGSTNIFDGILLATDDPGDQTMGVNFLIDYLHYTNITLEASNNITWNGTFTYTLGGAATNKNPTLTLKAGNLITINGAISSSFDTGLNQSLKLTLNGTANDIIINNNINTFGGSINMTATGGNITVGNNVTFTTGEEFGTAGSINLIASNGLINIGSGTVFNTTVPSGATGGTITITNPENVTNSGTLNVGLGSITLVAKPPYIAPTGSPTTPTTSTPTTPTTSTPEDYYKYNFNNYIYGHYHQNQYNPEPQEKFDYCANSLANLFSGDNLAHIRKFEKRINEDIYNYYLGNSNITCKGNISPQARLRQIEELTGRKGALIYMRFVPENEVINDDNFIWLLTKSFRKSELNTPEEKQPTDQLEITLITGNGDVIKQTVPEATRKNVKTLVNKFIASVTDVRRKNAYVNPSKELYNLLIKPIESELNIQQIDNLGFIMDNELRSLSVAALYDEKTEQFLVEKYSLAMIPSFSLTNTEYTDIKNQPILGMGSEKFENKNQEQNPLPAVPTELSLITSQIWQGQGDLFLNENFTIQNLQELRNSETPFSIFHLATHGEFRSGSVDHSYIQFWDNKLTLDKLETLRLNRPPIDLLVLSACRTAVGDQEAELGFAGLAIAAGVKTSLGSLWYVSDQGTLALMTSFYNALNQAPIKAEAVRQAQLALINGNTHYENGQLITDLGSIALPENLAQQDTPDLSHPYYWSAFTMVGSPW